jgi:hypothetical protein
MSSWRCLAAAWRAAASGTRRRARPTWRGFVDFLARCGQVVSLQGVLGQGLVQAAFFVVADGLAVAAGRDALDAG